ncbi:MAG: hypothetical protein KIG51_08675 [Fibrobacter sp.]|nr:hypothetical protein [Fibrobacter sp.]
MERLTYFKDGYWRVNFSGVQYQADFVDRLAAYEDTGLSPEKVSWMKEVVEAAFDNDTSRIERAHNLHVADKDGRVVVLPCKVGDTVWRIVRDGEPHITRDEVRDMYFADDMTPCVELVGGRVTFIEKFGKTVFLSREEAEKALQEMEDKKDGKT